MSFSSAQNGIFACKIRKARASQAASAGNDHFATQQNDFRYQTAASIRKLIRIKGGHLDAAVAGRVCRGVAESADVMKASDQSDSLGGATCRRQATELFVSAGVSQ